MAATADTVKRPKRAGRSLRSRLGLPAVVLVGLTLLLTACGGSSGSHVAQLNSNSTTSSSATQSGTNPPAADKYAASLAYSHCMRSNGIPSFPDPRQVGGGIQISGSGPGIDPESPLFKSAQQSCKHLLPNGGQPPSHGEQRQELTRMLHSSRCMRSHGIAGFPDPTLSPPSSRAGHSAIMSNGVAWLAIPDSIDLRSPPFERAAAACNLGLS